MARFQVCFEVGPDGRCTAHVPELPGCAATGSDREEALAALKEAIADYLTWLRSHDESQNRDSEPVELETAEEATISSALPGSTVHHALFQADLPPVSSDDLQTAMRRMEYARQDLLGLVDRMNPAELDWRAGDDAPSVAETLLHLAQVEAWLLSCLDSQFCPHPLVSAVRCWAYQRLSRLGPEERSRTTVHHDEKWTARKVLRRLLEHEREHAAQIRQLLEEYRRRHPEGQRP